MSLTHCKKYSQIIIMSVLTAFFLLIHIFQSSNVAASDSYSKDEI
jgi:hypothetical protein